MLNLHAASTASSSKLSKLISLAHPEHVTDLFETLGIDSSWRSPNLKPLSLSSFQINERTHVVVATSLNRDEFSMKEVGGIISRAGLMGEFAMSCEELSTSQVTALIVGLVSGGYSFTKLKSKEKPEQVLNLTLLVNAADLARVNAEIERATTVNQALNLARDLANTPANHLSPADMAGIAIHELADLGVEAEVWDEQKLRSEKCGSLIAVGQGSSNPPRLVKARYGSGPVTLSLIGKGITFDSGGLSLKPADSMLGMKYDMTGAAVVLGALIAIAKLRLPICVEAILCLAENLPGPDATRPGDVVVSRSGITIEVTNTDAEGRLVLADGISVALESNPEHIVDVATLTGAATIALGNRYGGIMGTGTSPELFLEASSSAWERFWRMPLPEDSRKLLDSSIADIMNAKVGSRAGGMLVGAQFLNEFVNQSETRNWAHLDIANVAANDGAPYEENPSGPTAFGLRSIVRLAENLALAE